ncbi:SDR family oxidoreductase [Compostimonas suwonensis]|uniref:NAD(P)-dependent dehydrogenase (Short-subunit alcohol dehydrogenase family) n=1 Tax=Compostimonas suwonensis TaxID=1048394 RepID=A0A2M9C0E7_9MICO|nr:SDR family oxidoreductase [Compostimonas suwonensis]PJJ63821.1 NAD(P)-dependent dehydrogenase (short-subunit alcohol dehydrogenase family) [Compostimonas suwonensis]
MTRTFVVTGAASGIGRATSQLLEARGEKVISVDLRDADIEVDLSSDEGVEFLASEAARLSGGTVDGVLAIAGLAQPVAKTVEINYYGTIATLESLRPLLLTSAAPRAALVTSMASLFPPDDTLLDALLDGTRATAMERAEELAAGTPEQSGLLYGTSKRALARWLRRTAASADWAGAGIPLNGVAPGVVTTPMTAGLTASEADRAALLTQVPMPLGGIFGPEAVADLLAWLVGESNGHLCGQIVFIDGGSDVVIRGDSTW